jgi:hypothetical protein
LEAVKRFHASVPLYQKMEKDYESTAMLTKKSTTQHSSSITQHGERNAH